MSDQIGLPEFFSIWYMSANRHGERKGESPFRYRLPEIRDGGPMTFLGSALSTLGLSYGGPIFNLPPRDGTHAALGERVKPESLIVLATRPPISDPSKEDDPEEFEPGESKKLIERSGWNVESAILDFLEERVFHHCSRAIMEFTTQEAWPRECLRISPTGAR